MHCGRKTAQLIHTARGHKEAKRVFAARAPAPVSSDAVSCPLITRVNTPTLKKEMNFSWASISLRAAVVDFGRHVEHRMLSQSRVIRPENRHGLDASGAVFSENICTYLRPMMR
jgi:hypothetical protein